MAPYVTGVTSRCVCTVPVTVALCAPFGANSDVMVIVTTPAPTAVPVVSVRILPVESTAAVADSAPATAALTMLTAGTEFALKTAAAAVSVMVTVSPFYSGVRSVCVKVIVAGVVAVMYVDGIIDVAAVTAVGASKSLAVCVA